VNDVTVRPEFNSGYTLVAVDGKPVVRAHGTGMNSPVTYVPFAWVEPGTHSLTLKLADDFKGNPPKLKEEVTLTAKLEVDKRYRFAIKDGAITVVEDFE
jgi:hypothetical protein